MCYKCNLFWKCIGLKDVSYQGAAKTAFEHVLHSVWKKKEVMYVLLMVFFLCQMWETFNGFTSRNVGRSLSSLCTCGLTKLSCYFPGLHLYLVMWSTYQGVVSKPVRAKEEIMAGLVLAKVNSHYVLSPREWHPYSWLPQNLSPKHILPSEWWEWNLSQQKWLY